MELGDYFICTAVLEGGPGQGKEALIAALLGRLAEAGHVAAAAVPGILAAVLKRERLGSTGMGRGLAIPHARHAAVSRPLGVLAVCRNPVPFDSLDGEPVSIVALGLAPAERPGWPLGQGNWGPDLYRQLIDPEFGARLRVATTPAEVAALLVTTEGRLTEAAWAHSSDPTAMLERLRATELLTARKARLFGAACCRRLWDLIESPAQLVIEGVERQADGLAHEAEVAALLQRLPRHWGQRGGIGVSRWIFAEVAVRYLVADPTPDPGAYARDLAPWAVCAEEVRETAPGAAVAAILRDQFGPLAFRPVTIPADCLAWRDGGVVRFAEAIYEQQAFEQLPVLADALEESGCADPEVLGHLRRPGPHFRGCHVLDLILRKK
jgi:mannitol/fructose-specific phosphotransferase system IIA component (Ntr-type)